MDPAPVVDGVDGLFHQLLLVHRHEDAGEFLHIVLFQGRRRDAPAVEAVPPKLVELRHLHVDAPILQGEGDEGAHGAAADDQGLVPLGDLHLLHPVQHARQGLHQGEGLVRAGDGEDAPGYEGQRDAHLLTEGAVPHILLVFAAFPVALAAFVADAALPVGRHHHVVPRGVAGARRRLVHHAVELMAQDRGGLEIGMSMKQSLQIRSADGAAQYPYQKLSLGFRHVPDFQLPFAYVHQCFHLSQLLIAS